MFGYQHIFFFHILDRLKLKNPSKKLVSKNLLSIGRYNLYWDLSDLYTYTKTCSAYFKQVLII